MSDNAFCQVDRSILRAFGMWLADDFSIQYPKSLLVYSYRTLVFLSICFFVFGQLYDIYTVLDDVLAATENGAYMIESACLAGKLLFFFTSRKKFANLLNFSNCKEFKPEGEACTEIWNKRLAYSRRLSKWFFYAAFITVVFVVISPLYEGRRRLPCTVQYPFVDVTASPYYEMFYIFEVFTLLAIACNNCAWDTLISAFMSQALVQLECLIHILENVNNPIHCTALLPFQNYGIDTTDIGNYREFQDQIIRNNLKAAVEKHKMIIKYTEDLKNLFEIPICLQYLTSGVVICCAGINIFVVSISQRPVRTITHGSFLGTMFVEIFLLCWFGNEIMTKSELLSQKLFHTQWMYCSPSFKSNMKIFMAKTQSPIVIKARKMFVLNLKSFSTILNTSYSYFALLHHLYMRRNQN